MSLETFTAAAIEAGCDDYSVCQYKNASTAYVSHGADCMPGVAVVEYGNKVHVLTWDSWMGVPGDNPANAAAAVFDATPEGYVAAFTLAKVMG